MSFAIATQVQGCLTFVCSGSFCLKLCCSFSISTCNDSSRERRDWYKSFSVNMTSFSFSEIEMGCDGPNRLFKIAAVPFKASCVFLKRAYSSGVTRTLQFGTLKVICVFRGCVETFLFFSFPPDVSRCACVRNLGLALEPTRT